MGRAVTPGSPKLPRARATVESMSGYTPGEQPAPGENVVKLNTNENPYPPSPRVIEAIRGLDPERLRRYPNPTADVFRDAAARLHGMTRDMILAGNGSDDVLAIALRTFVGPGDVLAYPDPTYSLYPVLARIGEVEVAAVPWAAEWRLPVAGLLAASARAIFFANPNAPSGTLVDAASVRALAEAFDGVLLVDEAYVDFADADCAGLVADCPNVVIARSLSKAYALAGLRLGYALAAAPLVAEMMKVKDSYNCDAVASLAGAAALDDQAYARRTWEMVRAERRRLSAELVRRGFRVVPSQANFVLAAPPDQRAGALYLALKARGILVRYFDAPGLADQLRITVGTPEENDALLKALG